MWRMSDSRVSEVDATSVLLDQPFTSSEMGDSMEASGYDSHIS